MLIQIQPKDVTLTSMMIVIVRTIPSSRREEHLLSQAWGSISKWILRAHPRSCLVQCPEHGTPPVQLIAWVFVRGVDESVPDHHQVRLHLLDLLKRNGAQDRFDRVELGGEYSDAELGPVEGVGEWVMGPFGSQDWDTARVDRIVDPGRPAYMSRSVKYPLSLLTSERTCTHQLYPLVGDKT